MTDLLVYATATREAVARAVLGAACQATGMGVRLEVFASTGSLYQRLGPRRGQPFPAEVMWFGPFAAAAATADGLLRPHEPARVADAAIHDANWMWTSLDYSAVGVLGEPPVASWPDLATVPRLALADPERSEVGMSLLLAVLDQARQTEGDAERGWAWWQQRARSARAVQPAPASAVATSRGIAFAEDDAGGAELIGEAGVTHALTLADSATPLVGLAPIPHAVGLAAHSRNLDDARRLLDWLTSEAVAPAVRLSPWRAASNGLQALVAAAPPLDVEWCRQQYNAARQRWAQSGFAPQIAG